MLKLVSLLHRRPGMTVEDFRTYYEDVHVPLIRRLLPLGQAYRRTYPIREHVPATRAASAAAEQPFDVITELVFDDEAALERLTSRLADPEVAAAIIADEERFLDRARSRSWLADVRE